MYTIHNTLLRFSFLFVLLVTHPASAAPKTLRAADDVGTQLTTNHKVVGACIAVWRNGKPLHECGYGYADRESKKPATADTLFRLASVSKPITAIAALHLVEQGKIKLDADARKWIPEYPEDRPRITLRQLLSHTAGIRHYFERGVPDPTKATYTSMTTSEAIGLFINDAPIAKPGEKYSYSTHAYTLVARAIELSSKKSFSAFVRAYLKPLAGGALDCEVSADEKASRSEIYEFRNDSVRRCERREDNSWKFGGGGLEASGSGLAQLLNKLLYGKILKPNYVKEMWSQAKLTNRSKTGYGLGWGIGSGGLMTHTGSQQGARSCILVDPSRRLIVVILCNTSGVLDNGELSKLAGQLRDSVIQSSGK